MAIRLVRRLIFALTVLGIIVCIVLLLNVTARNPTGRRYSTQSPTTEGSADQIGNDGERILARDLRLPNNNDADQRQCFCRDSTGINAGACNSCRDVSDLNAPYRRPDFVSPDYIAESKNVRTLSDFDQLADYAKAARITNRPLWVYVRINTSVEPEYYKVVNPTGGGIVYYFTYEGYVDPVDDAAGKGLVVLVSVAVLTAAPEFVFALRLRRRRSPELPSASSPGPGGDGSPLGKAARKMDDLESFHDKSRESARRRSGLFSRSSHPARPDAIIKRDRRAQGRSSERPDDKPDDGNDA